MLVPICKDYTFRTGKATVNAPAIAATVSTRKPNRRHLALLSNYRPAGVTAEINTTVSANSTFLLQIRQL